MRYRKFKCCESPEFRISQFLGRKLAFFITDFDVVIFYDLNFRTDIAADEWAIDIFFRQEQAIIALWHDASDDRRIVQIRLVACQILLVSDLNTIITPSVDKHRNREIIPNNLPAIMHLIAIIQICINQDFDWI